MNDVSRKFIISVLFSIAFIVAFFLGKFSSEEFILGALGMSGSYSLANLVEHFIQKK